MTTTSILALLLSALSFLGSLLALWLGFSNRRMRDAASGFSSALLDAKRAIADASSTKGSVHVAAREVEVPYAQAKGADLAAAIAGRPSPAVRRS